MKKIILVAFLSCFMSVFSQLEPEGNRNGTIFYSTVNRAEDMYSIEVELYEYGSTRFVEVELFDENNEKITSRSFEILKRKDKYYLKGDDAIEKEVFLYNMKFQLPNPDNSLKYPKIKVKMLSQDYQMIDFSQKVFY